MKERKLKTTKYTYIILILEIYLAKRQIILKDLLSKEEIKKYKELKLETLKNQYLTSKGLTRFIIQNYLKINGKNINFEITEGKGKPSIPNTNLKFNVSHSKDFYVIALTLNDDIGVDIEAIKDIKNYKELSQRFF